MDYDIRMKNVVDKTGAQNRQTLYSGSIVLRPRIALTRETKQIFQSKLIMQAMQTPKCTLFV